MKPKLYLETTIPSYLVARRSRDLGLAADQEATERWWQTRRSGFDLFISTVVIREIGRGDPKFARERQALIVNVPILEISASAQALADKLLVDRILPQRATDDALHLAIAAAHHLEFLLTWNCTHINNAFIQRKVEASCRACGFNCPVICTPHELMNLSP
jgi:hypothetical protein